MSVLKLHGMTCEAKQATQSESKIYCCGGTGTGRSSVWGTSRMQNGINWSTHKMYP